jgi:hypothetical protein
MADQIFKKHPMNPLPIGFHRSHEIHEQVQLVYNGTCIPDRDRIRVELSRVETAVDICCMESDPANPYLWIRG